MVVSSGATVGRRVVVEIGAEVTSESSHSGGFGFAIILSNIILYDTST